MRWAARLVIGSLAGLTLQGTATGAEPARLPELRFADLYRLPAGPRGLEPSARLQALVGARVALTGYVVHQQKPLPDVVILAAYPLATDEDEQGLADDLPASVVYVHLPEAAPEAHAPGLVRASGVLEWGPRTEADGRVSWIRLHAAADDYDRLR